MMGEKKNAGLKTRLYKGGRKSGVEPPHSIADAERKRKSSGLKA